jgi:hypothetical protein
VSIRGLHKYFLPAQCLANPNSDACLKSSDTEKDATRNSLLDIFVSSWHDALSSQDRKGE